MDAKTVLLVAGLPFAPWAWRVLRALVAEAQAAAEVSQPGVSHALRGDPPRDDRAGAPQRTPSFRAVPVRVRRGPRWEGGFGRRNL